MCRFSFLFVMVCLFALPVQASSYLDQFNASCHQAGKTESYCSCALDAFSDQLRNNDKRDFPIKKMYLEEGTSQLLADPAITQDKINAVCKLHDKAQNLALKASIAKRMQGPDAAKMWLSRKSKVMQKKEDLALSYGASRQTNAKLASDDYCQLNYEVKQMEDDMSKDGGSIYPKARRSITMGAVLDHASKAANRAGCE